YTFVGGDNGVHAFTNLTTLKTSGNQTVTVTDTVTGSITGTSGTIAVSASAATHYSVTAPASATAGTTFSITVTALDQFNNTATGYAGTVHFTSSDGQAVLPANSTLTNGTSSFNVTLKTSGNQTITGTDTVTNSITGTSGNVNVTFASGGATHYTVSAPANATAGTAFSITVTAQDQFGKIGRTSCSTEHFTSSDGQAVLPANSTLINGTGTFSVTLKTSGNQTITGTDTVTNTITGTSGNVNVSFASGGATHYTVSAPANATAGTAFSITVTAQDQFGNTVTNYTGTVHFTSSDGQAVLPGNYTFVGGDNGTHVFNGLMLKTVGSQTVTATDQANGGITGLATVNVSAATGATQLSVTAPANATTGTAFSITVTAQDQFGNTITNYTGTVHFTSS